MAELFSSRHIGPNPEEIKKMASEVGVRDLNDLSTRAIPSRILSRLDWTLPARSENEAIAELRRMSKRNRVKRSYIGLGYYNTLTPSVIRRNILENPGWYTAYTPYQAEISQGRMEVLFYFQTMVADLTGLPIANASLLDEATAAAEAMTLCFAAKGSKRNKFFVSQEVFPQTIDLLRTRAEPLGIEIVVGDEHQVELTQHYFGILLQYPCGNGLIEDVRAVVQKASQSDLMVVLAADILSLTLLESPGELGADVCVGSTQRFGVPIGFGGPHAAFLSTKEEYKRLVPGRFIGKSTDSSGNSALRLALQTREQHIRRERATSNICTSQVLLAVIAATYALYHGPDGLRNIALQICHMTEKLAKGLEKLGFSLLGRPFFDTISVKITPEKKQEILARADLANIAFRSDQKQLISISLDEATRIEDLETIWKVMAGKDVPFSARDLASNNTSAEDHLICKRKSSYLTHPVFSQYRTETKLVRYLKSLENRDLSLTTSMIPLGSCTMKLTASNSMDPIVWPEWNQLHPFASQGDFEGYRALFQSLENWLCEITGFAACSLQPNAGSQGEYAGLLAIRRYHLDRGDQKRKICLIPSSAHGTNPASAVLAGMKVVVVGCDQDGNVDLEDLTAKISHHRNEIAALMMTYPSTHGVFEEGIIEMGIKIHEAGGLMYMDGANLNALVGLCRPADLGADVIHLNLHKTFSIPHGGGGPGVGPICVGSHLTPYLPSHWTQSEDHNRPSHAVSAAPWGSAGILPISWSYIAMMGSEGLKRATQVAILNANYIAKRLETHYPILYRAKSGFVAHECIIDLRSFKKSAGISVDDVAKRLMDYGFHAPTMSWPVAGTLMIEPTESESLDELDRFCDAMIAIRKEILEIEEGKYPQDSNVLVHAPHTQSVVIADSWDRPYSREKAVFPLPWVRERKFWPAVGRVDNAYGDRHFVCTCN